MQCTVQYRCGGQSDWNIKTLARFFSTSVCQHASCSYFLSISRDSRLFEDWPGIIKSWFVALHANQSLLVVRDDQPAGWQKHTLLAYERRSNASSHRHSSDREEEARLLTLLQQIAWMHEVARLKNGGIKAPPYLVIQWPSGFHTFTLLPLVVFELLLLFALIL